jgi:tRNA A-37 threonylcarbamoyl transferase component Bud32
MSLSGKLKLPCRLSALLAQADEGWTLERGLALVRDVARQAQALHEQGQWHGSIDVDNVVLDKQQKWRLLATPATRTFGGPGASADLSPLELHQRERCELSTSVQTATEQLGQLAIPVSPRQIDAHQLGAILCRLTTGESVAAYRLSPTCKAKVPPGVASLLDRALGHEGKRFETCQEFAVALRALLPDKPTVPPTSGPAPIAAREDLPFTRLGHYRIVRRLGRGGMGDVFEAQDETLDRAVAIKVLPAEFARHPEFIRRFRQEATAAAGLSHPHVVQIHAVGEDAGHHFFVMQLVDGETLADLLARRGKLPVDEALALVEPCLAGLAAAHKRELIHRDVKPANILIDRDSRVMIADFGLVKRGMPIESAAHTATGVIMGTMDYIAPEQARGHTVDARCDLYAFGVVLYQMLAGRLPFIADTPTALMFQHAYEAPPPLSSLSPELPPAVIAIVERLMAKRPDDRYNTALETLEAVRTCRKGLVSGGGIALDKFTTRGDYEAAAPLPAAAPSFIDPRPANHWEGLQRWLHGQFHDRAPQSLRDFQRTSQQLDGAIASYENRRQQVKRLFDEAAQIAADLATQVFAARGEEEAALCAAAADHQQYVARLELDLNKHDAQLVSLRTQRDILMARMKAVAAEVELSQQPGRRRRLTRRLSLAIGAGLGLLAVAACAVWWLRAPTASTTTVAESAPITAPVVVPSTPAEKSDHTRLRQLGKQIFAKSWGRVTWSKDGRTVYHELTGGGFAKTSLSTQQMQQMNSWGKDPVASPDGSMLAFVREIGGTDQNESVFVLMLNEPGMYEFGRGAWPSWSANSERVYYHSRQMRSICVSTASDRRNEFQVVAPCNDWYATVSPDEKYYTQRLGNELQVVELDSREVRWRWKVPTKVRGLLCSWTPDSQEICIGGFPGDTLGLWTFDIRKNTAYKLFDEPVSVTSFTSDGTRMSMSVKVDDANEAWYVPLDPKKSLHAGLGALEELPGEAPLSATEIAGQPKLQQISFKLRDAERPPVDGRSTSQLLPRRRVSPWQDEGPDMATPRDFYSLRAGPSRRPFRASRLQRNGDVRGVRRQVRLGSLPPRRDGADAVCFRTR